MRCRDVPPRSKHKGVLNGPCPTCVIGFKANKPFAPISISTRTPAFAVFQRHLLVFGTLNNTFLVSCQMVIIWQRRNAECIPGSANVIGVLPHNFDVRVCICDDLSHHIIPCHGELRHTRQRPCASGVESFSEGGMIVKRLENRKIFREGQ